MKTQEDMKKELHAWIVKNNAKIKAEELCNDTDIIRERIINSLQIIDLLLFVERLSGTSVEVEQLKPGAFKNIDTIYQNFLERQGDEQCNK
ncbi:MAG: hypothetical protein K2W82_08505 [Candidatus Obscuribacterales bacterium]|nr:hypothetical protein [Candidatus Obscuribacterales bacterium]